MRWRDVVGSDRPLLSWTEYVLIEFGWETWHRWKSRTLIGLDEALAAGPVWEPPRTQPFGRAAKRRLWLMPRWRPWKRLLSKRGTP